MATINEWKVSGEIFYLKELEGEFGASVKMRSTAKRQGAYSSSILEFACLIPHEVFSGMNIKMYDKVVFSGHLESWNRGKGVKNYFIVDSVEEN